MPKQKQGNDVLLVFVLIILTLRFERWTYSHYSNRQLVPQSIKTLKLNPPATSPCSENSNARQLRMKKKIDSENKRDILNLSLGPTQIEECEEITEVNK